MPPIYNDSDRRRCSSKRPLLKRLISSTTINRFSSCGGGGGDNQRSSSSGGLGCGSWRRRRAYVPDVHKPLPKQPKPCSLSRSSSFSSSPPTTSNSLFFHHNPIASFPSSSESSPSGFDDRSYPSLFDPDSGHKLTHDDDMSDQQPDDQLMMDSETTTPTTTPAFNLKTDEDSNKFTINGAASAFLSAKLPTAIIPDFQYASTDPANPSSSAYTSAYTNKLALGNESVAVVKDSSDPYDDFRGSMLQMIVEREIYTKDGLQELLACFLRLNSTCHHEVIIRAFTDVWYSIVTPCTTAPTKVEVNVLRAAAPTPNPTPDRRWR